MHRSRILGTGSYLPQKTLTNADFEKMVDTSDAWILERTGISSRQIAADDQATSDLAFHAASSALTAAGLASSDLDAIVVATVTADHPFPSAACTLSAKLGCKNPMAFDVSAACTGFLYAFSIADQFIQTGYRKRVLVVGAETLSRITDYEDRSTCVLFGDGAGAAILGHAEPGDGSALIASDMSSDGSLGDLLLQPAGGSRLPASFETVKNRQHYLRMNGREIFKAAVRAMEESCGRTLAKADVSADKVDWLIPHQANVRIMNAVSSRLGFPEEKTIANVCHTGNTSSASVPIAFDQAVRSGKIKRGQTALLTAFGGGLTSGSALIRY